MFMVCAAGVSMIIVDPQESHNRARADDPPLRDRAIRRT
jgi:hypothetical protein